MRKEYDGITANVDSAVSSISLSKKFNYIKLHGSFNWRTQTGTELMVLGSKKSQQILEQPLLGWYHEVFKNLLFAGDVRLMIIGYGFGDEHVNEIIAQGIHEHGLRIMVWDRHQGFEWITKKPSGDKIIAGLIGFESRDLMDVFPPSQMKTESYQSIRNTFFLIPDNH